jgi:hypothetical protein
MTIRDVDYKLGHINYTITPPNIAAGVGAFDLQSYKSPYPDSVTVRLPRTDELNLDPPYMGPTESNYNVHLDRYIVKDDYGNVVVDVPAKSRKIQDIPSTTIDEFEIKIPDAVSKKSAAMHTYYNQTKPIAYKYNEGETLKDITAYVNKTYSEHYSQNKFQTTEFVIDSGHGEGFCIGNMLKYTQRYGRKGEPTEWRKDLMKVIHYAIMMLHVHDEQHKKKD